MIDVLHFSFTVSDLDRSVVWYVDTLGLELVARQRSENEYIRTLVGVHDAVLEVAQFKIPKVSPGASTHILELIQYLSPQSKPQVAPIFSVGSSHLAFLVADIDDEYERMKSHGVTFVNPPVAITEGVNAGGAACYFADPDGNTLELLMPPPHRVIELTRAGHSDG